MKISGIILQFLGVTVGIIGSLIGGLDLIARPYGGGSGLVIAISSLISGVFLYGVGASFRALAVITENSIRTANAMEFMARRRPKAKIQPGVYPTPTQEIPLPPQRR